MFKNKLYWKLIRTEKLNRSKKHGTPLYERTREAVFQASKELLKSIKPKKRSYNFRLSRMKIIGRIYQSYYRLTNTFKNGSVSTIIGKVQKNGNCEYPNTKWYRLTKAWKILKL